MVRTLDPQTRRIFRYLDGELRAGEAVEFEREIAADAVLAAAAGGAAEEERTAERAPSAAQAEAAAGDQEDEDQQDADEADESPEVFVPSESISEDISVPFPVDI
jgi:anti-sigma factor RsiW